LRELVWMEGAGNRFALHDSLTQGALERPAERIQELAGGPRQPDGLLVLEADEDAGVRMTVYNRDGSRPEACGNGLRCLALAAVDAGHVRPGETFSVATDGGVRRAHVDSELSVRVSMGAGRVVGTHTFSLHGQQVQGIECEVGNPHVVLVRPSLTDAEVTGFGPEIERDERFPRGTNVEFVVGSGSRLRARVWERGVGETAACGTGACAIAIALAPPLPVEVCLPGGTLIVDREDGELWLTGPVVRLA